MKALSIIFLLTLLAAGCSVKADADRETQATRAFDRVAAGDADALRSEGIEKFSAIVTDELVAQMRAMVPDGEKSGGRVVRWASGSANGTSVYQLVQEFNYPDHIVVWTTVMVQTESGEWGLDGVHINQISRTQAALMGFNLAGRSPLHYLILAMAVVMPVFCLVTASVAARRRRWGWLAGSLVGVGMLSFNWATGAMAFNVGQVSLLSSGVLNGGSAFDPWFINLSLPLPAIAFWVLRRWRPKEPPAEKKTPAIRRFP